MLPEFMLPETLFSDDYSAARAALIAACEARQIPVQTFENTAAKGVNGEKLFTDVARIGPHDASRLLVIGSGTHGIEGFCGSACQLGLAQSGLNGSLPADTAVLLVHALNPHGFSHCRRVDENNVDINRNFMRFDQVLPENPDYDEIHPYLCPREWPDGERVSADLKLAAFIEQRGERAYQAAVSGGQYSHPDGIFYGGTEAVWSNRNWQGIVSGFKPAAELIVFIDVHSGLGPYGHGELILDDGASNADLVLAKNWFGNELTSPSGPESMSEPDSVSAVVTGSLSNALHWQAPGSRFVAMALEFGTRPIEQVINALRADNWLYSHQNAANSQHALIKSQLRDAFNIEEIRWRQLVWERFSDVLHRALAGISAYSKE